MSSAELESKLSHHVESFNRMGTDQDPHEYELIENWKIKADERALKRLLDNHEKLVRMVVNGYRGYDLPTEELVAEGHIGLVHAVKNFEIALGFKFSTYAVWWVKSMIQEYVFKASSLLNYSGSKKHKRMFFKLRSLANKHGYFGQLTHEQADHLAQELEVTKEDVLEMHAHLSRKDLSTNEKVHSGDGGDNAGEWQDWVADTRPDQETYTSERQEYIKRTSVLKEALHGLKERERLVFFDRRLKEPPRTLEDLGNEFGLSKERIRQIEDAAFKKIEIEVKRLSVHHGLIH